MAYKSNVIAIILTLLNLLSIITFGKKPEGTKPLPTDTTQICLIEDDPVIKMLDSLSFSSYFSSQFSVPKSQLSSDSCSQFSFISPQLTSDSVYNERLKKLNLNSPCNLYYNEDVRKYIEIYAYKKRNLTSRLLTLSQIYFPIFEPILDKYGIPLEIKYLAIVESALNPMAISPARAAGIWQFIPNTGKLYNLNKSTLVDDRFDIYKATEAACRHMHDLYQIYHNWELVLAAYNAGAGCVNRAIVRSGGKRTFIEIRRFLPRETRAYVPAFIAVNYIMNYASEHNIEPVTISMSDIETDTVTVRKPITFSQISEMLKIPYDFVKMLNPSFRKGIIPAGKNTCYRVRLPKEQVAVFINNEDALYTYKTKDNHSSNFVHSAPSNGYHTVRKGECLSKIANKYNCTIAEIKLWNKLKSVDIHPGQKLFVFNPKEETSFNTIKN